jgi:hypothetical protein
MDTSVSGSSRVMSSGLRFPTRRALCAWLQGTNAGQEVLREVCDWRDWLFGTVEGRAAFDAAVQREVEQPRVLIEVSSPTPGVLGCVTVYSDDLPRSRVRIVQRPGAASAFEDDGIREIVKADLPVGWRVVYDAKQIGNMAIENSTLSEWSESNLEKMWTQDMVSAIRAIPKHFDK